MAIKTYKGTDKDMKCREFQFEQGVEYEAEGEIKACKNGFHGCETPLDVLKYYEPGKGSRYFEAEQDGDISRDSDDSKIASRKIKVGAEIGIPGLVKAQIEYVTERTTKNTKGHSKAARSANSATGYGSANSATGYRSANSATGYGSANSATGYRSANSVTGDRSANSVTGDRSANSATGDWSANSATGYRSANSATGDRSANSATGDWSANSATGYRSANSATGYGSANLSTGIECSNDGAGERNISVAWGRDSKCKGAAGCFLVLSEWGEWDGEKYPFCGAVMVEVDGETIKADTWYQLIDGQVREVE